MPVAPRAGDAVGQRDREGAYAVGGVRRVEARDVKPRVGGGGLAMGRRDRWVANFSRDLLVGKKLVGIFWWSGIGGDPLVVGGDPLVVFYLGRGNGPARN